ncbi:hypothetical protein [endosymbiont GvMRE of Glomus versiforme]|uniref:hypothetical protein n=1 Tax=endosymbiont GvMRE of Glomus versiforme TaxID=2039283 RepID=UPI000EE6DC20|nr:hypothetical protein [endosymbiont GvMRE of Glomus versiforme]RHZ35793.1 hypothetical protein GvMRE_Ic5g3 [endosymbiont GvMRE of Glomus versiforme]
MKRKELLERIEKLEQAIQDIRASCGCVRLFPSKGMPKSLEKEWPEIGEPGEHECDRECPDAPCVKCGEYGNRGWED